MNYIERYFKRKEKVLKKNQSRKRQFFKERTKERYK